MPNRSPAHTYARVCGYLFPIAGILVLAGVLDRPVGQGIFDIAIGLAGLVAARSYPRSRGYALGAGAFFLLVGPFVLGHGLLVAFHVVVGAAGVVAGLLTPDTPAPSVGA